MAISLYEFTAAITVPAGAAATVVPGEPMTGGLASVAGTVATASATYGDVRAVTYPQGQLIALDPAGKLYAAIIAVNASGLRQVTPAQDSGGGYNFGGTSN